MKPLAPRLRDLLARGEPAALVTVAEARGSTPREAGARMLVTLGQAHGTIGGGRLEYDAILEARALLASGEAHALREVPLGPALGQCCGGHATVLLERAGAADLGWLESREAGAAGALQTRLDAPAPKLLLLTGETPPGDAQIDLMEAAEEARARTAPFRTRLSDDSAWLVEPIVDELPQVLLFGAGHVGRALATALEPLPCRVRWIDQRPELLADPPSDALDMVLTKHPVAQVEAAPAGVFALVMTFSHDLDCDICEAFLKRGDFAFLGLIGSATKRARFEKRWRAKGIPDDQIQRLVCPIGLSGIGGKHPEVIAASTAAQLLMAFERQPATTSARHLVDV